MDFSSQISIVEICDSIQEEQQAEPLPKSWGKLALTTFPPNDCLGATAFADCPCRSTMLGPMMRLARTTQNSPWSIRTMCGGYRAKELLAQIVLGSKNSGSQPSRRYNLEVFSGNFTVGWTVISFFQNIENPTKTRVSLVFSRLPPHPLFSLTWLSWIPQTLFFSGFLRVLSPSD